MNIDIRSIEYKVKDYIGVDYGMSIATSISEDVVTKVDFTINGIINANIDIYSHKRLNNDEIIEYIKGVLK